MLQQSRVHLKHVKANRGNYFSRVIFKFVLNQSYRLSFVSVFISYFYTPITYLFPQVIFVKRKGRFISTQITYKALSVYKLAAYNQKLKLYFWKKRQGPLADTLSTDFSDVRLAISSLYI